MRGLVPFARHCSRRALILGLGTAVAFAAAGCAQAGKTTASKPKVTPSPSSSPTSSRIEERAVISAYTDYWPTSVRAATLPEGRARELLTPFLTPDYVAKEISGAAEWKRKGLAPWGRVVVHVTELEISGQEARLTDCQDASAAGIADADSGRLIPGTIGGRRVHIRAVLQRGTDGRWRISEKRLLDTPCTRR